MCADHGVWDEGEAVSCPKSHFMIQAANMTRGTTGVCVLAARPVRRCMSLDGIDAEPNFGVVDMRSRAAA